MKSKIIPEDNIVLRKLIQDEIQLNGNNCDLNHIDVSAITDFSSLFTHTKFNGNISQWDVSNAKNMSSMFLLSEFNNDISSWDVSNVEDMDYMFSYSIFNQDLSDWEPISLQSMDHSFHECLAPTPYWANPNLTQEKVNKTLIQQRFNKLNKKINTQNNTTNRIKI